MTISRRPHLPRLPRALAQACLAPGRLWKFITQGGMMHGLAKPATRLAAAIALPLLMLASPASAVDVVYLNFPSSITVPRDRPIGSVLATAEASFNFSDYEMQCLLMEEVTVVSGGARLSKLPNVYETNVPGIGLRYSKSTNHTRTYSYAPTSMSYRPSIEPNKAVPNHFVRGELVVIGPVAAAIFQYPPRMRIEFSDTCKTKTTIHEVWINTNTSFSAATCSVTFRTLYARLPPVPIKELSPIGTVSSVNTDVNIDLTCNQRGMGVYVTLTDMAKPSNTGNNLTLAPTSTARGVALRLSANDKTLSFGPDSAAPKTTGQWYAGSSWGVVQIPIKVRYVSTGTVQAGSVIARATFTMSYQ